MLKLNLAYPNAGISSSLYCFNKPVISRLKIERESRIDNASFYVHSYIDL